MTYTSADIICCHCRSAILIHNNNESAVEKNNEKKEKEKEKGKAKSSDPSRGSDVNQSSSVIDTRNNDDGNDDAHEKYWNKKTLIRLRHSITHRWLSASSKFKYTDANCPHCPILGDVEVSARSRVDDSCVWRVAEDGAFFGVTV
mmetsp:Transcript_4973/g.10290  ORF Transcript_4973/g.10290 Transcript_4973/m.10290 type:complete len:145 (-) Transcript_4973:183-617(-)